MDEAQKNAILEPRSRPWDWLNPLCVVLFLIVTSSVEGAERTRRIL